MLWMVKYVKCFVLYVVFVFKYLGLIMKCWFIWNMVKICWIKDNDKWDVWVVV